ncbi:phosphatidate cytidylyltransferase, partial [Treponema sp. R6D11]
KTVVGAVGGALGAIVVISGFVCFMCCQLDYTPVWFNVISLGLIVGVFAQLGDLVASRLKREFKLKDFGALLPGHGGIMDRCDSIMFVAPIVLLWIRYIGLF